MLRNTSLVVVLSFATIISFISCKKNNGNKTTCTSSVHAYTAIIDPTDTTIPTCHHGIVNLATGVIGTSGTFSSDVLFTNQGAFNTSDNCYYTFKVSSNTPESLYKVDASGVVTAITAPDTAEYNAIAYNGHTGKLYCMRNGSLVQIAVAGASFTTTTIATSIHAPAQQVFTPANFTVNNATGDMYITTGNSSAYYIEKWQPGSSSFSVVASAVGGYGVMELRYNSNDNMLYAMEQTTSTTGNYIFIKINPATGVTTSLAGIGYLNSDMYSATLDPCSNHYIISTEVGPASDINRSVLFQLNMTGAVVQTDTTTTLYQGLTAY